MNRLFWTSLLLATPTLAFAHGDLFLVGGRLDRNNTIIYETFIEEAGGKSEARIAVLTISSIPYAWDVNRYGKQKAEKRYNSKTNGEYYAELLKKHGASHAEWIPLDCSNPDFANHPGWEDTLKDYTGFFFGGGDQSRYIAVLYEHDSEKGRTPTPFMKALQARVESGATVLGTSAGSAVQSGPAMVTSGDPYFGLVHGITETTGPAYYQEFLNEDFENPVHPELEVDPLGGLGFFQWGMIDTHFSERGRQARLIYLAAALDVRLGVGVDENTALWVKRKTKDNILLRVLGESGVHLFEIPESVSVDRKGYPRISGILNHYFVAGDSAILSGPPNDFSVTAFLATPSRDPEVFRLSMKEEKRADILSALEDNDGRVRFPYQFNKLAGKAAALGTREPPQVHQTSQNDPVAFGISFRQEASTQATPPEASSYINLLVGLAPVTDTP